MAAAWTRLFLISLVRFHTVIKHPNGTALKQCSTLVVSDGTIRRLSPTIVADCLSQPIIDGFNTKSILAISADTVFRDRQSIQKAA